MEDYQTIYYGEDKTSIININQLRDVEISILNYMLLSVENWIKITSELDIEYFTFASNRRMFHIIYNTRISEKSLEFIKKKYRYFVLKENKEVYIDLNYSSASFILNSNVSNNIDFDLVKLKEYYKEKLVVFQKNDSIFFTVIINSPLSNTTATFKDNRLIDIITSNLKDISEEIEDTFKSTLNNLIPNFNKKDNSLNVLFDEETKKINGFLLKKDIQKLEKIEKFKEWLKQNNLENNLSFSMISNISEMSILEIENQNIKYLPNEIDIFEKLLMINLNYNDISTLPFELSNIKDLMFLGLSGNKIEQIPNFIYDIKKLSTVCLRNNKLFDLNENIEKLQNLKTLIISKNKIKVLPKNISKLLKLEELAIENNPNLENIYVSILKLPNLKKFCLDDKFLPFIVSNKTFFSKINCINLKYSNYRLNDELISLLDFHILNEDWQENEQYKYFGAICLSTNEIADDYYKESI